MRCAVILSVIFFAVSASLLAQSGTIPISGTAKDGFAVSSGDVHMTGPNLSLFSTTPGGPSVIGQCVVGSVCNLSFSIQAYCLLCVNGGGGYSGGQVGTAVATVISPSLTVSGSAIYSGGSSLEVPITISGGVIGYPQICSPNCSLGTPVFSVDILGTGSATLGINPVGNIGLIQGANVSFTGIATPINLNLIPTTTGLNSSANPSMANQEVTYTATVTGQSGVPTGTVTFTINGSSAGSVALSNGQATLTWTFPTLGSQSIVASYSGDANYEQSISAQLNQTVGIPTTTVLSSSANPATSGQQVTFTATVTANGQPVLDGTVSFSDGLLTILGTASVSSGAATLTTSVLGVGDHSIIATYTESTTYEPSISATLDQSITTGNPNGIPTITVLNSSANPAIYGQLVTFTATASANGQAVPDGTVNLLDSSTTLGTASVSNGVATLSTSALSVGGHSITAQYSGDATYAPSTSAALNQNVVQGVVTFSGSPQQPLTTDGSGNFVANVTITNMGNVTVNSIQVTSATLGAGSLLSAPAAITTLAAGAGAVVTLKFPPSSVPSGATTAPLKLGGTYSVTNPALGGNWTLSFRTVTL